MKRYLVFYGEIYYPKGGMNDFIGDSDTLEAAKECVLNAEKARSSGQYRLDTWAMIYDTEQREIVYVIIFDYPGHPGKEL